MSRSLPWYKSEANNFTNCSEYQCLELWQRGAFRDFLDVSWERLMKMVDEDHFCKRALGLTLHQWRKLKEKLIELGLLVVENGYVISPWLKAQFEETNKKLEETNKKPEENQPKKVEKSQQNQRPDKTDKDLDLDKDLNKHNVHCTNDDLIPFELSNEHDIVESVESTCTNPDNFKISHSPCPVNQKSEYPDIPLTNGRRMVLSQKYIDALRCLDTGGLVGEILNQYRHWLLTQANLQRSKPETIFKDIKQRIKQAINERKLGYGDV